MTMTGNTMLVTGATSGVGRALAEAFHDRGNQVVVAGRRRDKLDEVIASRPGMQAVQLDQDKPASLARLAETVRARHPALNVLVANAGISQVEDMATDGWTWSARSPCALVSKPSSRIIGWRPSIRSRQREAFNHIGSKS